MATWEWIKSDVICLSQIEQRSAVSSVKIELRRNLKKNKKNNDRGVNTCGSCRFDVFEPFELVGTA